MVGLGEEGGGGVGGECGETGITGLSEAVSVEDATVPERCMAMNQAYQEILNHFIVRLECGLSRVREQRVRQTDRRTGRERERERENSLGFRNLFVPHSHCGSSIFLGHFFGEIWIGRFCSNFRSN